MNRHASQLFALCALLLLLPATAGAQTDWASLSTEHFDIRYPPDETRGAQVFAAYAEKAQRHVAAEFGVPLTGKVIVFLAPDRETFTRLQPRNHVPEWAIGTALSSRNTIVMFSPRGANQESVRADAAQVFAHELAHIELDRLADGRYLPRWFQEGVAQLVAREWRTGDTFRLSMAVLADRLIPLANLGAHWPKSASRAKLAYVESLSVVIYLRTNLFLKPLLERIAAGESFHDALIEVTGRDLFALEADWHDFLHRRQTWMLLLDDGCIWFFAAAVLFVGYLLVRARKRRKYETLDDDLHPKPRKPLYH